MFQGYLYAQPIFIKKTRELINGGNYTGAISYLKSWENVKLVRSDKIELFKMEGEIYLYYLKLYNPAIKAYRKALSLAIPLSDAYLQSFFGIAQAYVKKGEVNKAVNILKNLKNIYRGRPEIASINYMLQEVEKKLNNLKKIKRKKTHPTPQYIKVRKVSKKIFVRVRIGNGFLTQINTTYQGTITITLPSGISDKYKFPLKLDISQFPYGTTFVISTRKGFVTFNHRRYRGNFILIYKGTKKMEIINVLPLEDYLKGVLPWEISPKWPIEAIKAQAVAARTYALYHILQNNEYDLESTILSQVYKGADIEKPRTNFAIRETKDEVIAYNGLPILAYFHSCNGGFREIPENVWGISLPYFKQGIDPWCLKNPQRWRIVLSLREITFKLKRAYPFISHIKSISLEKENIIVKFVILKTQKGAIKIKTNDFRLIVGPSLIRSEIFSIKKIGNKILFWGRGYGHGVGLSQWGAYYMAKAGKNYKEILSFYYPGTRIVTIDKLQLPISFSRAFP